MRVLDCSDWFKKTSDWLSDFWKSVDATAKFCAIFNKKYTILK